MNNSISAKYRCPQIALYIVCRKGWQNAKSLLTQLSVVKSIYTETFIENALKAIEDSEKLPDFGARESEPRQLRTQLLPLANTCTDKYVLLQSYIDGSFPETERKIMYQGAGHAYFAKASGGNWKDVSALNTSMNNFIEEHSTQLSDLGKNMPADFPEVVTAATQAFALKLKEFEKAEETHLATVAKIKANNAIYKQLMSMFKDARRIFRRDNDTARLFIFERLLFSVAPTLASFTPRFIDDVTNLPVNNVKFILRSPNAPELSQKSNAKGLAPFGTIESGNDYKGSILPPDIYQPVENFDIAIPKGEHVRKVYRLKRAA